ncbi:MAG: response regulator [Candidatus Hinthialibacter antarcticus]|nr:response regulator [Candidatus Hinthialibacter antarcticus]
MVNLTDKHSVLIVDDDRSYRSILQTIFADGSYTVSLAEDGKDALEQLQISPVDLVITDLQMPNLDGVSLIQEVKRYYPATAVIVMSAYTDEERYRTFLSHGSCPYLPKPFRRADVLDMACELLQQPRIKS